MKKKIRIITYGTFDLFHIGHLNILKRLSSLGDELIVGVSTDEFNERKNKKSVIPYAERRDIVSSIKFVDKTIPESSWKQKIQDIQKYNIHIFGIGDDWKGEFDYLKEYCEVVYLERTPSISSNQIKKKLNK